MEHENKHYERKPRKKRIEDEMTCAYCGKLFPTKSKNGRKNPYLKHMKRHQAMASDCGCGEDFTSFAQKNKHMRVTHLGYFGCDKCCQSFKDKVSLTEHEQWHIKKVSVTKLPKLEQTEKNEASTKVYICEFCDKSFMKSVQLHSHRKIHREKVACQVCGKAVKNMFVHMRDVHTDDSEQKFRCDQCSKGFGEIFKLKSHMMSVHLKTRPYKCRFGCTDNIGYNDLSNRNSHEKKKHGRLFELLRNQENAS